jgi:uncharacterized membrane protein
MPMSWGLPFRVREYLRGSLWIVPLLGGALGVGLAEVALWVDGNVTLPDGWRYSEATASTVLSGVVAAMVALTGIVVAIGVLILQQATGSLSPRFMRLWYRDRLQKAVLACFIGTLAFAYALLRRVSANSVPDVGVTVTGLALAASLVLLLLYLDRFVHRLRPVGVAALVARAGAEVLDALSRSPESVPTGVSGPPPVSSASDPAVVVRAARPGVIQAIDVKQLVRLARRYDCLLVLPLAIGDFVPHGAVVVEVFADASSPSERRLRRLIALGRERTIEQDPAFALRVLVDIALLALSPAVNAPTTAVQVLDYIEDLLQSIGESEVIGRGELRDELGQARVRLPARGWEDYLALGITEVRDYGATAPQVTRRLRAMLESLLVSVRPENRHALEVELVRLDAALDQCIADPERREFAGRPDRQGIGGPPHGTTPPPPASSEPGDVARSRSPRSAPRPSSTPR